MTSRGRAVVLCIDVEPDGRAFDDGEPPVWDGLKRLIETLPAFRERLAERTGATVAFTWLLRMDPQIEKLYGSPTWLADTFSEELAGLVESGDELGLHTHPWRWDEALGKWIADYRDPAWAEVCLGTGLDAFEARFGRTPGSHRAGDRYLTGGMLSMLGQRGVRVDLTPEPGQPATSVLPYDETSVGTLPSYRGAPVAPYRSSAGAYPAADPESHSDPLIIPLVSTPTPHKGRRPVYLDLRPTVFKACLATALAGRVGPVIAFALRSDLPTQPQRWKRILANLDHVAARKDVELVAATDAAERVDTTL